VQVFTHPLWLMILAGLHALSTDDYRNVILLSAVCTALTLYVLWRIARRPALWLGAVGLLVASRAFVEFCSSGLENPLSFALTALFFWQLGRWESQARDPQAPHAAFRQLLWLTLGLGLALTNRLDLACLLGPAWLWAVARTYRRHRGATAAIALGGLSPWFGWCAFALVYYGFVLPNTAYAKLPPNLTLWDRIPQGGWYLIDTIEQNPIAIVGLALAIAVALRSRRLRVRATGWGILGYLAYVIWVGGDFMSGRFLTEPFLAAVILLLQSGWVRTVSTFPVRRAVVAGSVGVLGVLGYGSAWPVPHVNTHGIADERAFYFPYTDLWRYWTQPPGEFLSAHPWVKDAREIAARNEGVSMHYNIGFLGYELGTRGIVIDRNGLADPLLARLPCKIPWRIGHYGRVVPAGYPETLQAGTDRFLDPAIGRMWVDLHGIASDPLWSGARWRAIARAHWRGFQPPRTASDYAGEPEPGTK
jgi:arabinofuranosyltransferase